MASDTEIIPVLPIKQDQRKGYLYEFKWLFKNAVPLVISYLLQNSLQSVGIMNAGHIVGFNVIIYSLLKPLIFSGRT